MSIYYVGIGGNDGSAGTAWSTRKLTLNGAEDIPVAAGDTVYVGAGTYRELLTVDVSGTAGNPITYIGDYTGANTDKVGGVIRITGSADDIALTRANCITATSKNYRTFQGFLMDGCSSTLIVLTSSCSNWVIDKCFCQPDAAQAISVGGTGTTNTIQNCVIFGTTLSASILFTHTGVVDNAAHLVQNCIIISGGDAVRFVRVGGTTIKNSTFVGTSNGVKITTAITIGQTETVNNCLFHAIGTALVATVTGEITENYNNFIACSTNRTNVNTGANSLAYITMFDPRWAFEMMFNNKKQTTPFDLMLGSPLIEVAGTSPTTTDLRNSAVVGSNREWGALEYNADVQSGIIRQA